MTTNNLNAMNEDTKELYDVNVTFYKSTTGKYYTSDRMKVGQHWDNEKIIKKIKAMKIGVHNPEGYTITLTGASFVPRMLNIPKSHAEQAQSRN